MPEPIKVLFCDTETGGVIPGTHALLQVAALVYIDWQPVDSFCSYLKPFPGDEITDRALEVNGLTRERIETFPEPKLVHDQFCAFMEKHVSKFDRCDKFYLAGYNIEFDFNMILTWFEKCEDKYLGSFIHYSPQLCLKHWLWRLAVFGRINFPDYKLSTACEKLKIPLGDKAHDALVDVKACADIMIMMIRKREEREGNGRKV